MALAWGGSGEAELQGELEAERELEAAEARLRGAVGAGEADGVGAVVDVRGPPIENDGCEEGWYRVNPRGFVCMGLGATLALEHPVSVASARRPIRGKGLPYAYALSNDVSPLLYFRLPSLRDSWSTWPPAL